VITGQRETGATLAGHGRRPCRPHRFDGDRHVIMARPRGR
jgi:hypothetical protein